MRLIFTILCFASTLSLPLAASGRGEWTRVWEKATLPSGFEQLHYLDVFFLPSDPNYGWICGFEGSVLLTTDGGVTWQGLRLPGAVMLESIQFLNRNIGYTSGPGGIFRSDDGGRTWRDLFQNLVSATPDGLVDQLWGLYFTDVNTGVALAGGCAGTNVGGGRIEYVQQFFRTTDGGRTWRLFTRNEPASGLSDAILEDPNGLGYAVSSGLMWQTLDGGRTWSTLSQTPSPDWHEEITNVGTSFLIPASIGGCSGSVGDPTRGAFYFSRDLGQNWTTFRTNGANYGTFLINDSTGWGVGDYRGVYYTSDGGRTWAVENCGIQDHVDDIWFINDTLGWCVGRQGVYRTISPNPSAFFVTPSGPIVLCAGQSVRLTASAGFTDYRWSDGQTGREVDMASGGQIVVSAFDPRTCSRYADTVGIDIIASRKPTIRLNRKPYLCSAEDSLVLSVQGSFSRLVWSTGDTSESIVVRTPGVYRVIGTYEGGCSDESDPIEIRLLPPPQPRLVTSRRTTICVGDSVVLTMEPDYARYRWSTGDTTKSITVTSQGFYLVAAFDTTDCEVFAGPIEVRTIVAQNKIEFLRPLEGEKLTFDSVEIGMMVCDSIVVRNRNPQENLIVDSAFFKRNRVYSIPQSRLPLVLAPGQIAAFNVCYAPWDWARHVDTLFIQDTCSDHVFDFDFESLPQQWDGDSRCRVPVDQFKTRLSRTYSYSPPHPNPSDGIFSSNLAVSGSEPSGVPLVVVVNALGEEVPARITLDDMGVSTNRRGPTRYIDLRIDLRGAPHGRYAVIVSHEGTRFVIPISLSGATTGL